MKSDPPPTKIKIQAKLDKSRVRKMIGNPRDLTGSEA